MCSMQGPFFESQAFLLGFRCLFTLAKSLEMAHEINDKRQMIIKTIKTYFPGYCYSSVKKSRWEVRILLLYKKNEQAIFTSQTCPSATS